LVVLSDEDVRRLDVPVDDPLLVRVLDRLADRQEELQPLAGREVMLVAVLRDRLAFDQFHHEVRPAALRRARVQHLRNVRMVHHRQRLPLGLKPCDHLPRIHPRLDDLKGHAASDRLLLLGHVNDAHDSPRTSAQRARESPNDFHDFRSAR
jgi:hypothetical protein